MDFVVAGLGFGALVVVFGFVVRDLGPLLWTRFAGGGFAQSDDDRWRWRGFCLAVSSTLTAAGALVLVATVGAVLFGSSDRDGGLAVGVATVAATIGAFLRIALSVRDYRHGRIEAAPDPIRREEPKPDRKPALSSGGAGAVASVRRVRRPEPQPDPVANDAPATIATEPLPDEPFDVTRLLPSEFDEAYEEERAQPAESPSVSSEVVESAESPVVTATTPASQPSAKPAAGLFKSPLLADIGVPAKPETAEPGFSSTVLADVEQPAETPAETFQSPLLVDVMMQTPDEAPSDLPGAVEEDGTAEPEAESNDEPSDATDTVLEERTLPVSQRN